MRIHGLIVVGWAVSLGAGCSGTKPGTHVELVDKGGQNAYVAGAAAQGLSRTEACRDAVGRALATVAQKFADEHDDIADDLADELGVDDGRIFLASYAKEEGLNAAVQDISFDPAEHVCMATVRWTPPVFIKDAVRAHAQKVRAREMGGGGSSSLTPGPAPQPQAFSQPQPAAPPAPPAGISVAPAPAAPPVRAAPVCTREKSRLGGVLAANQKGIDELNECLRRTSGDETICYRYKLAVERAGKDEAAAGQKLVDCVNAGLSSKIRVAISRSLPGHAAHAVENRGDGTVILWTFSPVDQTAYVLEVRPDGNAAKNSALAANQLQWLRTQLGL